VAPTLRFGRVFGIEIYGNWSLVFVFALIAWSLASGIPADVPGRPQAEYVLAGIAGALVFYLCLLAHELAHSLTARHFGVRVSGITLWLFGGVSNMEGEPKNAREELAITAVGPLTSLVLSGVFYLIAAVLAGGQRKTVAIDVVAWLAYINLALGLFNLIPAFPLDGGRVLASLLWWRGGDRRRAVHTAVRVGRWFAFAMIAIGFVEFLTGQVFDGVWIAFLGWFLLSAASAEESGTEVQAALSGVPVSAAMSSPVVTLPDWLTVEQLLMSEAPQHSFTTYPVRDQQGKLSGVVRLPDLVGFRAAGHVDKRLREVAHPIAEMPTAQAGEDLVAFLRRVGEKLQLRALVYDGDRLVGIVSPADVTRLLTLRRSQAGSARGRVEPA
jgi:Zn-dependent protease